MYINKDRELLIPTLFTATKDGTIFNKRSGRAHKTCVNDSGYALLTTTFLGKRWTFRAHRIVATLLIPKIEGKPYVNHKNSIRHDNRVENLEWCTHQENMQHGYESGYLETPKTRRGEDSPNAIISDEIVEELVQLAKYYPYLTTAGYAEQLGIKRSQVKDILNGRAWTHITSKYPLKDYLYLTDEELEFVRSHPNKDSVERFGLSSAQITRFKSKNGKSILRKISLY